MINHYISYYNLLVCLSFFTYKYHLGAWEKTQQTLEFSQKWSYFLLYTISQNNGVHKVRRSFAAFDQYNGLLYLGEKHI